MKSKSTTAAHHDPQVAATIRLLHRRRGWIWATVISVAAWLTAVILLGELTPGDRGAGVAVGSIFVLLLTVVAAVALVASVADTVRLHRRDASVRQRARQHTAHYPARAHGYSYPPRHRFTWVFGWIVLVILLGIGVSAVPGLVDGVAYLAGAESTSVFLPTSYGQDCGRSGCTTVTNGFLANGTSVTWPDQVPIGHPFPVRQPVWDWGLGTQLIDGVGTAIALIVAGVLFDGFSVIVLVHVVKLARRWLRHHQQGRAAAGSNFRPGR